MHPISKRIITVLLLSCFLFMMGCTGTTQEQAVDNSQYLAQEAIEKEAGADQASYKYDTAFLGDFYEKAESNGSFYIQDSKAARAEYQYGKMICDGFLLSVNTYVKAGEAIANVHIDVSDSQIEEVKLAIQRMQERIVTDQTDYAKADAILKRKAYAISDSQAQGVAIHEYEESVALHSQDLADRQTQLAEKQEELEKMQAAKAMTQIVAPIDGYAKDFAQLKAGDEIKNKKILAVIEPMDSNILTVNNSNNDFHYGKQVLVMITTVQGEEEMTGMVITPSQISVASQAQNKTACIRLDKNVEELPAKEDIKKILVTVRAKELNQVVMLTRGSLTEEKNNTYATVVKEDGSFQKQSVMIGGVNKEYYWILKGLNEGDTVVIP